MNLWHSSCSPAVAEVHVYPMVNATSSVICCPVGMGMSCPWGKSRDTDTAEQTLQTHTTAGGLCRELSRNICSRKTLRKELCW